MTKVKTRKANVTLGVNISGNFFFILNIFLESSPSKVYYKLMQPPIYKTSIISNV